MTLSQYLGLSWEAKFDCLPSGLWRVTVTGLVDFEVFGTEQEVKTEWQDALASHLKAYMAKKKTIPTPAPLVSRDSGGFSVLRWGVQDLTLTRAVA